MADLEEPVIIFWANSRRGHHNSCWRSEARLHSAGRSMGELQESSSRRLWARIARCKKSPTFLLFLWASCSEAASDFPRVCRFACKPKWPLVVASPVLLGLLESVDFFIACVLGEQLRQKRKGKSRDSFVCGFHSSARRRALLAGARVMVSIRYGKSEPFNGGRSLEAEHRRHTGHWRHQRSRERKSRDSCDEKFLCLLFRRVNSRPVLIRDGHSELVVTESEPL